MSLRYNSVKPSNQMPSYSPFDNIDFEIDFPNRKVVANSIRIVGGASVKKSNAQIDPPNDKIYMDNLTGAHAFFSEMVVSTSKSGNLQNIQSYPRYIKMKTEAQNHAFDMNNSNFACELRTSDASLSNYLLNGVKALVSATDPDPALPMPFAIKPDICLNNMSALPGGDTNISYSQTGTIRISTKVSQVFDVLYGADVTVANDVSIELSDISLTYRTIADDGKVSSKVMKAVASVKQSLSTTSQELNVRVPAIADSVSCSFLRQAKVGSPCYNTLLTEVVPHVQTLEFGFNGTNSQYVTYQIKNRAEIIKRYVDSLGPSKVSDINKLYANSGYGVGLNFNDNVDLSKDVLNIRIDSALSDPMVMFLYFHSTISM